MSRTPEAKVKDDLRKMFRSYTPHLYWFMPVQAGFGAPALDFHCVCNGFAFMVETKAPSKNLTPRQIMTADKIRESGARVFIVRNNQDIQEVEGWIRQAAKLPRQPDLFA